MIQIPAICPTCNAVFGSGIALGGAATVTIEDCAAGPCPNGHMGIIPNGTYRLVNGLLQLSQANAAKVLAIAEAAKGGVSSQRQGALDEIAALLPSDSAAAIKLLGAQNPLAAILIVLFVLTNIVGVAATAYRAIFPATPSTPVVNNNISVISSPVATATPNEVAGKPLKKEQVRRLRQMERQRQKIRADDRTQ